MIEIQQLTKRFDQFTAVDNLSFSVNAGEVLGFLGPNGAGKSTTMKMATGFLAPSFGSVRICDYDIQTQTVQAQKLIGYLPEGAPCYPDMTPWDFLNFIAEVRGFRGAEKIKKVKDAIEKIQLDSVVHRPIEELSKGFKRRVGLAQAIIHDPKVLILDEPTDGLDPNQKHQVRELIQNLSKDKIVVISTHILEEVAAVCSRAVIISKGKLVADGTPQELEAQSRYHHAVTIHLNQEIEDFSSLRGLPNVQSVESEAGGRILTVIPDSGQKIYRQVMSFLSESQWDTQEVFAERGRLEDVFRRVTDEKS